MSVFRFVFPFLFVRNWHNGAWEFSRARFTLFAIGLFLLVCGIIVAYLLQSPVIYESTPV